MTDTQETGRAMTGTQGTSGPGLSPARADVCPPCALIGTASAALMVCPSPG
jgi:hypothetical protein